MSQESARQHYNTEFGNLGERCALEEMQHRGYDVVPHGGSKRVDMLVNGKMCVEVKASHRGQKGRRATTRWQANLSRYGKEFTADLLLLLCFNGNETPIGAFVIPGSAIEPTLTGISISSPDPSKYKGKWAKFWNAWEQLDLVLDGIPGLYSEEEVEIPF